MASYIVGYDLNRPHQDYHDLIEAIKTYSKWWHYLDSTWIIVTNTTAKEIRDDLGQHIDDDDELLVVKSGGLGAWKGFDEKAGKWLKDNL
jgi:hypothetical protein